MLYNPIEINVDATTNEEWINLMRPNLEASKTFEIHCWNEEVEFIKLAKQYGEEVKTKWKFGKVIKGKITKEFIDFLLRLAKPSDTSVYNKMTPFFKIVLDNGFSSENYGTELNELI